MAAKKTKKVTLPRELKDDEYEIRDIQWAAGVKCPCGRGLDFFIRLQPFEMVCPICGRHYQGKLKFYEVE